MIYPINREIGSYPIYRQITLWLRNEISRHYQVGDRLPSEKALAEQLHVNRHTLRRGVDELVNEGMVARKHGVGVIVLAKSHRYCINSKSRFTDSFDALNKDNTSTIIDKQIVQANLEQSMQLQVAINSNVVKLQTLRLVENVPFCLITHYLAITDTHSLFDQYIDGSLHQFLRENMALSLTRKKTNISVSLPNNEQAYLLKMPKAEPMLIAKSVNINADNKQPVEYAITHFRGDAAVLDFEFIQDEH